METSMKQNILFANLVALIVLTLTACSTDTKLVKSWSDDTYTRGPLRNVLIIGVSNEPSKRRLLENAFTKAFKQNKVDALASLAIMPADVKIAKQTVQSAISGRNIDAVLVTRLVRVEDKTFYSGPHPTTYRSERQFRQDLWQHYDSVYDYAHDLSLHKKQRSVVLESNIYDAKTAKLIWSIQSETLDPKSPNEIIRSLGLLIIENLKKDKLI